MIPDHGNRPIRAINCGREQSPGHPALSGYLVVPSVRLELTLILITQRVCLFRHEGCMLLSFVFAGNLLSPPPITKVYHKQTSAVYPKRGLLHPFKSLSTSSSTSVFVTRCLYVEILVG